MPTAAEADTPTYSVVIPIYNEQEVLGALITELDALRSQLDGNSEVVFVDDGSTDDSWRILNEIADHDRSHVLVRLSRNFGHQIAVTAGLEHARGDAVVIMDADLQDPPEVVLEMSRQWRRGYQVVYGVRVDRNEDTPFKRLTAEWFYKVMNGFSDIEIPAQVGDFRLIDRTVVDALGRMPERNRYVRGMFAWLGFRQIGVEYARPARAAGTTKYSLTKMLRLASDGIIGYSKKPIRAITWVGATLTGLAALVMAALGFRRLVGGRRAHNVSAAVPIAGLAGLQIIGLGLVGEYVGRIFDETLDRPLYVTSEVRQSPVTPMVASVLDEVAPTERNGHNRIHDNVRAIHSDRNGTDDVIVNGSPVWGSGR